MSDVIEVAGDEYQIEFAEPFEQTVEFAETSMEVIELAAEGPAGPPGTANLVTDEIPAGAINGSNATFITAQDFRPESVKVFLNGIGQRRGAGFDYITTGNSTIQFASSPETGDTVLVDYEVI